MAAAAVVLVSVKGCDAAAVEFVGAAAAAAAAAHGEPGEWAEKTGGRPF